MRRTLQICNVPIIYREYKFNKAQIPFSTKRLEFY